MCDKKNIFLSYSHLDAEIATELVSQLKDAGLSCFVAERDITATQQWEPRIRDEIRAAQCVLILLTPRSKLSTWVAIEAGAAWVLETDIIPATMFVDINELVEPIRKYKAKPVETNAQRTTLIQELQQKLLPEVETKIPISETELPSSPQRELFNERPVWERLQKIGLWQLHDHSNVFQGEGINQYLLSHYLYGKRTFKITSRLRFNSLSPLNEIASVNAGIIFGWHSSENIRRYFNLMFSGSRVLLELIGEKGGPVTRDFQHIDEGVPFILKPDHYYNFEIEIRVGKLILSVDGSKAYSTVFEADPTGRVGIRPWRSRIETDRFLVEEI
jgi:hypothetical protein